MSFSPRLFSPGIGAAFACSGHGRVDLARVARGASYRRGNHHRGDEYAGRSYGAMIAVAERSRLFASVVTATFQRLYVFVLLDVGTRQIVHWNLTDHPNSEWTISSSGTVCLWRAPIASSSMIAMASSRQPWTKPFGRCHYRC